jgi:hypothetical protein
MEEKDEDLIKKFIRGGFTSDNVSWMDVQSAAVMAAIELQKEIDRYANMSTPSSHSFDAMIDDDEVSNKIPDMVHPMNYHSEMNKWLKGLETMLKFFESVDTFVPETMWTFHIAATLHSNTPTYKSVATKDVVKYIKEKLQKGFWSNSDKDILNRCREFYLINKGRGFDLITE